jgi:ankyrin repeat protein
METDVATPNNHGWTPLHTAADKGHAEVVKLLLKKGADTAVSNIDGATPLYRAACGGHIEVLRLLLKRGGANLAPPRPAGRR